MNTDNASLYVKWLKQEVAPALGCTEPVAISFAAAYAAQYLDQPCTKISGFISANLYKNAMGVTIPGTTVCGVPLGAGRVVIALATGGKLAAGCCADQQKTRQSAGFSFQL